MNNINFPKVLVLAHSAFSSTNSNGRTLGNFFVNWPKDKLAQFALLADGLDTQRCNNYFIVTDRQALASFKTGKPAVNAYSAPLYTPHPANSSNNKKIIRSPFTMLLRNLVWKSNRWQGKNFHQWLNDFAPELILLQAGDAPFMYDLAVSLAKKRRVPLVLYNSECYYFKDFCYFTNTHSSWLYPLFRRVFKHSFERAMQTTRGVIYITHALETLHKTVFPHTALTLMTASSLPEGTVSKPDRPHPQIVYLGNLGLNRYKNLIKIAQEIQKINPSWKLEIYGKVPAQATDELKACNGIDLKGFVPDSEVVRIQKTADLLLHTEYNDPFFVKDLKYAFSTKIADCLASGVPFLVYAPAEFPFVHYLQQNQAAFVATTSQELPAMLKQALSDESKRKAQVQHALQLARQNHHGPTHTARFRQFLQEIYEDTTNKHPL